MCAVCMLMKEEAAFGRGNKKKLFEMLTLPPVMAPYRAYFVIPLENEIWMFQIRVIKQYKYST